MDAHTELKAIAVDPRAYFFFPTRIMFLYEAK